MTIAESCEHGVESKCEHQYDSDCPRCLPQYIDGKCAVCGESEEVNA
jgi:hypothetical protein